MNLDFFESVNTPQIHQLKDAHLEYHPGYFSDSKYGVQDFIDGINWRGDSISLYGKTHDIPRLHAWYADPAVHYQYSGISLPLNPWNALLLEIKRDVEKASGQHFNGVLCNLYRNGSDYAAWHSDDEKVLGKNPTIASVSFGANRKFVMKHLYDKTVEKFELELEDASLFIMSGKTQHYWKHQLNKTQKVVGPRVNLTFRYLKA